MSSAAAVDPISNHMDGYKPSFIVLDIVFPILATLFVVLRFDVKRVRKGKWQKPTADDWCIVGALVFSYGWCINNIIGSQLGNNGGHTPLNSKGKPVLGPWVKTLYKTNYVQTVLTTPIFALTKISVLLLYQSIFASHAFRRRSYGAIALLAISLIAFQFAYLFACFPLFSQWKGHPEKCVNLWALYMASCCWNTFTDILILVWPLYRLSKLQMPLARKIAVIGIFVLGGIVTVISIIRIYYLAIVNPAIADKTQNDVTYGRSLPVLWTIAETNVGIICACLPLLRPLYKGYHIDTVIISVKSFVSSRMTFSQSRTQITGSSDTEELKLSPIIKQVPSGQPSEKSISSNDHWQMENGITTNKRPQDVPVTQYYR